VPPEPLSHRDKKPPAALFWLLPVVFVVHDAEELVTMPAWLASHSTLLNALAAQGNLLARVVASAPTSTPRAAIAITFVFLLLVVVTSGVVRAKARGPWLYLYCAFLGLLFLHVFTHIAQALLLRAYVPGLLGAIFAVLPGTTFIYRRLFAAELLTRRVAILTALAGFAVFVPGALLAWVIGRSLAE
jgi:hypothetical protein